MWKSELRARDVQLILRVSRIMPNWRQAQNCKLDDVGRVEVAKYILGSGGMDQDQLEGMEEMFSHEMTESKEEDGGADNLGEGRHYLPDGWYAYVLQWTSLEQGFRETQTKSGRILMVR